MNKIDLVDMVLVGLSQSITVHGERCSRMCHKSAKCALCETNCPTRAISVGTVGTKVNIDWDKCTFCGICINLCPSSVFKIRQMGHETFLKKYLDCTEKNVLKISCRQAKEGGSVECLGILGLTEILYFYTHGVSRIELSFPDCRTCRNKYGRSIIADEVAELEKLSEYFEHLLGTEIMSGDDFINIAFPHTFENAELDEKALPDMTRRGAAQAVFGRIKDNVFKSMSMLTPQEIPNKTPIRLVKKLPTKRVFFIDALAKLGKLLKNEMPIGAYFFAQSVENCKKCRICTKFCPTGALHQNEDDNLVFTMAYCIVCGMCMYSCYHKNIAACQQVDLQNFFEEVLIENKQGAANV